MPTPALPALVALLLKGRLRQEDQGKDPSAGTAAFRPVRCAPEGLDD